MVCKEYKDNKTEFYIVKEEKVSGHYTSLILSDITLIRKRRINGQMDRSRLLKHIMRLI